MGWRGSEWNAKAIDRLRELAGEGLSSTEIGEQLGKSRNSVIGQARRRGIALTYRQYDAIPDWPQSPETRPHLRPPPQIGRFALLELRSGDCRWPEGDRAPYQFCGAPQAEGGPYCGRHAAIAFNRPGVRAA